MFFIAYAFKGQVHVFAGRVKKVIICPAGQVQYFNIFSPEFRSTEGCLGDIANKYQQCIVFYCESKQ